MLNSLILFFLVITQVLGDICISQGMKIYGEITSFAPEVIFNVMQYLLTSVWFYAGLSSLTISWLIYLSAVAKMDLSYVLPIHAASYIFNGLLAWLLLGENVTFNRWLATLFISVGVLIVGLSKYLEEKKQKQKLNKRIEVNKENISKTFAFLPLTGYFSPLWLGVVVMVLSDSTADVLSAKGMRQVGSLNKISLDGLLKWVLKIFTNINMIVSMVCYSSSLLIFLALLSWDDLSLIRPASAVGYIVSLIFAKYFLAEKINKGRLIGISFISAGIFTLSFS